MVDLTALIQEQEEAEESWGQGMVELNQHSKQFQLVDATSVCVNLREKKEGDKVLEVVD